MCLFFSAFVAFRSFCGNTNSSESWWNACSSDWEWPLKVVQSFFFFKGSSPRQKRWRVRKGKGWKGRGGGKQWKGREVVEGSGKNIGCSLGLKISCHSKKIKFISFQGWLCTCGRGTEGKCVALESLSKKKRNEKHQKFQMVKLCLCWSPSLPLTKTHNPSYFPHNPLQTVRDSKKETENNKTSMFTVRYIAGKIW